MKSSQELLIDLANWVAKESNLTALILNGSRANPNAKKDRLQDFDVVVVCQNIEYYKKDKSWIDQFGTIAIMQEPENGNPNAYTYLIQFEDRNRIDCTFHNLHSAIVQIKNDPLSLVLVDKGNDFSFVPEASDKLYHVKKPTQKEFEECCNEFWWVATYVAKGLRRHELLYAMEHINAYVRPMYLQLLRWRVGFQTNFELSTGKQDKYLLDYLDDEMKQKLQNTFCVLEEEAMWKALENLCDSFSSLAQQFDFEYKIYEEKGSRSIIELIKNMDIELV